MFFIAEPFAMHEYSFGFQKTFWACGKWTFLFMWGIELFVASSRAKSLFDNKYKVKYDRNNYLLCFLIWILKFQHLINIAWSSSNKILYLKSLLECLHLAMLVLQPCWSCCSLYLYSQRNFLSLMDLIVVSKLVQFLRIWPSLCFSQMTSFHPLFTLPYAMHLKLLRIPDETRLHYTLHPLVCQFLWLHFWNFD